MKQFLPALLLIFTIWSCHTSDKNALSLLAPSKIPSSTFSIDPSKDTVIHTPKGAVISIPAGAVQSSASGMITLEIKEAYSISDIVAGGLLTRSDGKMLSSGGMIYINAIGENTVRIVKPINVKIPSPYLDKKMQLYKGETGKDGKINWTQPVPLSSNTFFSRLDAGGNLFNTNCTSCHAIGKKVIGPDLAYIDSLRPDKKWLYGFTRNNAGVLASHDRYANCLYESYSKTPMNAFPLLDDGTMKTLYAYIDNESKRLQLPFPDDNLKKCTDSCERYDLVRSAFKKRKDSLIKQNGSSVRNNIPISPLDNSGPMLKVNTPHYEATYYQFNIDALGWYNIDEILRSVAGAEESKLTVQISGSFKENIQIYLVIPGVKVFQQGGQLPDKEDIYGFYEIDGTTILPQNVPAFIIAISFIDDQIYSGKANFITSLSQNIDLALHPTGKEELNAELKSFPLKNISLSVGDSKNAAEIRKADAELNSIEELKPKNCNCSCGLARDTVEVSGILGY